MVKLLVLSAVLPPATPSESATTTTEKSAIAVVDTGGSSINSSNTNQNDALDEFNHPRQRRTLILAELQQRQTNSSNDKDCLQIEFRLPNDTLETVKQQKPVIENEQTINSIASTTEANADALLHHIYAPVHSNGLIAFLSTAWSQWQALGEAGRDPIGSMLNTNMNVTTSTGAVSIPPLIPACTPLLRCSDASFVQRPSRHVIGQVGYYCTDTCTPIFADLVLELRSDAMLVQSALRRLQEEHDSVSTRNVLYLLPHHPGHHAATDCFGGYCYLNHAAALAAALSKSASKDSDGNNTVGNKVAILDVDYHCGNGTAAIFANNDDVLVVSIHCDPDCDYPFHCGFAHDSNQSTRHIPLPPGTAWETGYQQGLQQGLQAIVDFASTNGSGLSALIVSLGLDTYDSDPCAIRRAGFGLTAPDYRSMGAYVATTLQNTSQTKNAQIIFVQEGGYRMDVIGEAAANVVTSFAQHW